MAPLHRTFEILNLVDRYAFVLSSPPGPGPGVSYFIRLLYTVGYEDDPSVFLVLSISLFLCSSSTRSSHIWSDD
jgi:hypothetical protein